MDKIDGRRSALAMLGLTLSGMTFSRHAMADEYPSRSVKLYVGNPAGGLGDVLGRALAQDLTTSMRQTFFVENKVGASGLIAADTVAKAPPDGYNLLFATDSMIVSNEFIFTKMPYDPERDIRSVALMARAGLVLVVNPKTGLKNAQEFIDKTKAPNNDLNYSSGGPGHPLHLAMELIKNRLGLTIAHVPYKGSAPAVQALLAGEVSCMMCGIVEVLAHIKAGKLTPLAATGPGSTELFPSLPLLKSFNPDLDIAPWFGLFAPRGLPDSIAAALNEKTNNFLRRDETRQRFAEFGVVPMPSSQAELDSLVASDRKKYGPLIKSLGLTAS